MKNKMDNKTSSFRWIIIGLLFFITVINYIDRASISYAIDSIAKEFHLSSSKIGFILGAFGIGYTITNILGGKNIPFRGYVHTDIFTARVWHFGKKSKIFTSQNMVRRCFIRV